VDKKLVVGLVLGIVLGAMLILAILGVSGLIRNGDAGDGGVATTAPRQISTTDTERAEAAYEPLQEETGAAPAPQVENDPAPQLAAERDVIINGRALTASQLRELASQYGVKPVPGDYWYDAKSGLYGAVGEAAAGFMLPGHDFGPLPAHASRGDTGVVVNGRIIPQDEHMVLNWIWGTYVQPTRYWLDAWGNVGYEGMELPIGNLFVQIQSRIQAGGGGGDNIWNTRFTAGNYTPDNSAGYVSVPGHGPIGYGN
jgi:hypothetical protein